MLNFYPPFLCRVLAAILKMADILKHRIAPLMVTYHYVIVRFQRPELIPDIKKLLPVSFLKMAAKIPQKYNTVRFQR
jgi:hypothetical protein